MELIAIGEGPVIIEVTHGTAADKLEEIARLALSSLLPRVKRLQKFDTSVISLNDSSTKDRRRREKEVTIECRFLFIAFDFFDLRDSIVFQNRGNRDKCDITDSRQCRHRFIQTNPESLQSIVFWHRPDLERSIGISSTRFSQDIVIGPIYLNRRIITIVSGQIIPLRHRTIVKRIDEVISTAVAVVDADSVYDT